MLERDDEVERLLRQHAIQAGNFPTQDFDAGTDLHAPSLVVMAGTLVGTPQSQQLVPHLTPEMGGDPGRDCPWPASGELERRLEMASSVGCNADTSLKRCGQMRELHRSDSGRARVIFRA
ncbi:MAG: hypothetical protein ABI742_07525 [Gemmatimonadota bacterium]